MDAMNSMSGGAVACPVCTLYLREGISLQKHLDTHPKEQVIEALIKASTSPVGVQVPSAPATAAAVAQPQQPPPLPTATNPTSSHSPYPIGPVFECPPIASMMPPQFASFSYQQFVNNGTMMIPQYAMAPQANQMMQMLYNPYGAMYQQQQIPAVQMIAPVSNMQTPARMRSMVSVASETTARSNVGTMNSEMEPKQILPEIEVESEVDQVLPDVQHLSREPQNTNQHETEQDNQLRLERRQITQNPSPSPQDNRPNNQINYQTAVQNLTATDEEVSADVDKEESVLPDIEDVQSPRSTPQIQQVTIHYDDAQQMPNGEQFTSCYGMNAGKGHNVETTTTIIDSEMEPQHGNEEPQRTSEQCTRSICQNNQEIVINDQPKSSTHPPEVEQLERLLITIMETQFNADSLKHKEESRGQGEKNMEATLQVSNANSQENDREILDFRKIDQDDDDKSVQLESCDEYEAHADSDPLYSYKNSLSAPASPATRQQLQRRRTYSMRSELGSTENLSSYPIGFEATTLQHDEDEDVDGNDKLDDNFNEEDMEIEEIASPHTPFTKHDNSECIRSHTPLSTISGISGLRVRTDLSKPCSPASAHSFHHMDTNSLCAEDDDADDILDPESEKDPIDCSQLEKEAAVMESLKNNLQSSIYDHKLQPNHVYHQSVITENVSSFPVGNHSQKPMIIHDTYSISNCRNTDNLLDLSEPSEATTSTDSKNFQSTKSIIHKPTSEILNINEDAHPGPMNVLEFDGLQILVPSTFVSESSQKAVSATSRQSMASSEGGIEVDEEVKSVSMRADETMPPRGELSEQESNGCHEPSAWQLYMGQESSRMSTSYDLMARESWEESEGSDNEIGGPLLDSRSLATHFTSSLFLDRDRKTPTKRMFKCPHCTEVFDCPKERRVHTSTIHKDAGPSGSRDMNEPTEVKDIKLLEGRMNMFDDIFVPTSHAQQPLLHQLQPAHKPDLAKLEVDQKVDGLVIPVSVEVSCTICGQQFTSEKSLQIHHRRVHHGESTKRVRENAKCQTCNEEFPSVVLFNTHLKIHPLECGQCGKYFYRKQNFKLHMKRHLGIKPFPCTVCDKAFLTKQKLDEHTNGHTGNAPVKCNLCNETFKRYSNLTQHKNRHHLNIKKKLKDYICHCGEVFHTKKKLAWHKETHDEKPKACTYCNERFIHMASLTRHMRRAHNRRFVPDAQRENENVECPICKCIYLRSSLAVHMRVHNGERPYECQVCSKAFSTKWNLQLHKWTHAARSTKPFKCNQCSAAFYRHSDYTAHMNSHRNVRPYTCNYCGAQFIRKYNCLRHVKEHEENKSYTCDICNKTFHRSYYLKEHLRVHSGARPYTCHICGKSSSTKSNHNKHVRIHHAREPVNTEN